MKQKILEIISIIILIVSTILVLYAGINQMILIYQKFGFILGGETAIFIPHWTAWFYLGALGYIIPEILNMICNKK